MTTQEAVKKAHEAVKKAIKEQQLPLYTMYEEGSDHFKVAAIKV